MSPFHQDGHAPETAEPLGLVVRGSLREGLDVKLEPDRSIEEVKVGQYVTVEGEHTRFFCMVNDVKLEATDPALTTSPPDLSDPLTAQVLRGTATYGVLHLAPTLTWGPAGPQPVRTVPAHFARAYAATQEEIEAIFGPEDAQHLWIGSPLDMEQAFIRLNIGRLVERSVGVFGKSGTGKTFITRILMAGILQKRAGVQLIFDMHNEYGWEGTSEGRSRRVKGLKQLFGSQVAVFTLDEESARARGLSADGVVEIGYDEVEPEDIAGLQETLNLTENAAQAVYVLERHLGRRAWLSAFLTLDAEGMKGLAAQTNLHDGTLQALQRRLEYLSRLRFLAPKARENSVRMILDYLERGKSVVLEFGRYRDNALAQVLVANMLSRRIYDAWAHRTEAAKEQGQEPPHLTITIEEAHKFLNPRMAGQTVFGTIAREMRKYNVTLLVVDQRPSGIDPEVLSQIGTKVSCLLEDDKDVSALLSGVSGASELRSVLSRLESVQQALIFGHAVPMPVVVRTRDYGTPESYQAFGFREAAELERQAEQDRKELFGR
ncbi:MAG: ATP-binding protein [Chloroflexi bacterium]|nr:ATP-binding protein [Chloroflexota bacterium]